ncbi:hypothetical protein KKC00_01185 [Patescibacteria group bacterium]|nr:hypothetical protein [Patescibacteria group bacterium]
MKISSQEKLLIEIVKILDNLGIKYFITGGFAVSVWGRPRATFDIDIVVKIVEPQAEKLAKAWRNISRAGYADQDSIKDAIRNKSEFNFIDPGSNLKVDFWVKKEGNNPPEFSNRKLKKINGQKIYFISPEDLILSKLQWYKLSDSERHIEDVRSVFQISGKKLNKKYLDCWINKLGLSKILEEKGIGF